MSRDTVARLDDMIEAAERVISWTKGRTTDDLVADVGLRYQIERAPEVLGEAAKHVPAEVCLRAPEFPWRKAAGLRDMLAHAYFDIDPDVLISVGRDALPLAVSALNRVRLELASAERLE